MREIIVIGTMHHMFPQAKKEFKEILEEINPDQILVEIDKKDLDSNMLKRYPSEMLFAYDWAKKNDKLFGAFDVDMGLLKKGVTQKDEDKIEKEWFENYGDHDWKFFNKNLRNKTTAVWTIDEIIDKNKMNLRQRKMLDNIKKLAIKEGKILIVTGAYHLDFFEQSLKEATFPYR